MSRVNLNFACSVQQRQHILYLILGFFEIVTKVCPPTLDPYDAVVGIRNGEMKCCTVHRLS